MTCLAASSCITVTHGRAVQDEEYSKDSEEEEGMDWDELEDEARRADKLREESGDEADPRAKKRKRPPGGGGGPPKHRTGMPVKRRK